METLIRRQSMFNTSKTKKIKREEESPDCHYSSRHLNLKAGTKDFWNKSQKGAEQKSQSEKRDLYDKKRSSFTLRQRDTISRWKVSDKPENWRILNLWATSPLVRALNDQKVTERSPKGHRRAGKNWYLTSDLGFFGEDEEMLLSQKKSTLSLLSTSYFLSQTALGVI